MDISVIVPVYNEVDSLALLHQSLHHALDGLEKDWEVVYVDDGSKDQSWTTLEALAVNDPHAC
jgi:glycosyltransferase involved in cell wall biosynthesis